MELVKSPIVEWAANAERNIPFFKTIVDELRNSLEIPNMDVQTSHGRALMTSSIPDRDILARMRRYGDELRPEIVLDETTGMTVGDFLVRRWLADQAKKRKSD